MSNKVMWCIFVIYTVIFVYGLSVLYQNDSKLERQTMMWLMMICFVLGYVVYRINTYYKIQKEKWIVIDEEGNEIDARETIIPESIMKEKYEQSKSNDQRKVGTTTNRLW